MHNVAMLYDDINVNFFGIYSYYTEYNNLYSAEYILVEKDFEEN